MWARAHLHSRISRNLKYSKTIWKIREKIGCICIQVIHTREFFQNKMTFYALCVKKTKSAFQKMCFRSRSDRLSCLFRPVQIKCHLILRIYTSVKNLYTYAPNFFQIFFMFYYFLNFAKKKGCRCARALFVRTQASGVYILSLLIRNRWKDRCRKDLVERTTTVTTRSKSGDRIAPSWSQNLWLGLR